MNNKSGPGSPAALRQANRERIVEELLTSGPLTQADLARATGLARSTVSNLVHELLTVGRLEFLTDGDKDRRSRRLRAAVGRGVVVGIDLGRFHLSMVVADLDREVLAEDRLETTGGRSLEHSLTQVEVMLDKLLSQASMARSDIRAGALALPAPIDSSTGRVGSDSILPAWVGIDPAAVCSERLGFDVSVHNDTNLGALGEVTWGAGVGVDHLAYVWVSEGVGSGLVLDGRLYAGGGGIAGELGHTAHRTELGDLCRCGNRGCLETVVSTRALVRLLEPQIGPLDNFQHIVDLAEAGNVLCSRVLADTGRHVGIAVADLVNLLDPQLVIIGGELAIAGDLVIGAVRQMVDQYGVSSAIAGLRIVPAELGGRSEVMGAVAAALQSVLHPDA